ncbi:phage tail protein [Escherichia albertii]|nr:phage tail protein [Escherichia albertii]MCZ8929796.1 phage tail protein [Escherichia albertii]MCZ9173357.1 phage tail protein [Escherichia albertii]MCZ9181783.1 phage tail protein [Escherichia albertii]MCZ9193312.1 phage tail protein [Escherichia albertii]
MSALLTKAFEKWVTECTASNLPARPDAIIFALMEREPTREDNTVPEEKITYAVNELTYGQLSPNNIVCSAVVPDDCAFSYDWICLIHQASRTLCGVIKTPVRQKHTGESLVRNFTITYQGVAQAAQITVPPQSWQVDITPELKSMLKAPNRLSEIAAEGEEAQQESRNNLGLKSASTMESQSDIYDRTEGCLAIPGAFGFGALFKYGEEIKFSAERGPTEFLQWVRETPPGRYLVSQFGGSKKNPIITGPSTLVFSGYLDIEIRTNTTPENQQKETKQVIFKGINGESYTARIHSGITPATLPDSWEKKLLKVDDFTRVLYSWTDSYYNLPDIGGLVLAAYTGDSDSESKKTLIRGRSYSGSRLRQATFYADFRSSGFESGPTALVGGADLSGTYISLSSTDSVNVYTRAVVGLFMRIA